MIVSTCQSIICSSAFPAILTARFHHPSAYRHLSVPDSFRKFYAERLCFETGARVRAIVIANEYAKWAHACDAPWMGPKPIKRAMLALGHRHFRSNRSFFGDVQLVEGQQPKPLSHLQLRRRVEALAHAVEQLRLELGDQPEKTR